MKVSEAMHSGAQWVNPEARLSEIARMMREQDIGSVPVGENDRLVGMVTDRDMCLRALEEGKDASRMTARDVMSEGIVYCRTEDTVEDAVRLMEARKIRRLPVIDEDKRLVGMLSLGDIAGRAGQHLTGELARAVAEHHA